VSPLLLHANRGLTPPARLGRRERFNKATGYNKRRHKETCVKGTERQTKAARKTGRGAPAWDIALMFPRQGDWTEDEYLELEGNPQQGIITVLSLKGKTYTVHGKFGAGTEAASKLLVGFAVAVDDVFAAGAGRDS
jgi:hypothetical protein